MKKKKLLIPFAVLAMSVVGVGAAGCSSCNDDKTQCDKHIDVNGDGICDECGSEILAVAFNLPETIAHGKVTADKSVYSVGDKCILTVLPDTGYEIKSLKVNGEEKVASIVNKKLTFDVDGDVTVTAEFELLDITLNMSALPEDCKVEFVKAGGYKYGEEVQLKITVGEDYSLVGFTVNGVDVLSEIQDGVYTVGEYSKNNGVIDVTADFIKEVDASVLTVNATDKSGAAVSLAGKKITLTNRLNSYELTFGDDGKLSGKIFSGEYKAKLSIDGYAEKTVTVMATPTDETFAYEFASGVDRIPVGGMENANDGKLILGGVSNSSADTPSKAIINIGTENAVKDTVFVEFTATLKTDIADAASWRRFGIILDENGNGLGVKLGEMGKVNQDYLYKFPGYLGTAHNMKDETLNYLPGAVTETALPSGVCSEFGANVDEKNHAGRPVKFRAVKAGNSFVLYVYQNNEWVFAYSYTSDAEAGANLKIMFLGCYCTFEISDISYNIRDGYTFVPYTEPTDTEYGKKPHFKDASGNLYNAACTEITEESVRIEKAAAVENAKIRLKCAASPAKNDIKLYDRFGKSKDFTYDAVTGLVEVSSIAEGNFTFEITIGGKAYYAYGSFTEQVKEVSLTLSVLTPENVTTAEKRGDGNDIDLSTEREELAALNDVEAVKNAKYYTFEVTVGVNTEIDNTNSWRINGITLSEGITLWQVYQKWDGGFETSIWKNDGTAVARPEDKTGYLARADLGTIPDFMNSQEHVLDGNGVRFKIIRSDTLIEVFAYNPTEGEEGWVKLFNLTCESDMENKFALTGCYESWKFSDILLSASVMREGLQENATVNVSNIRHGTVTASGNLSVGDTCTLTITPDKGYVLKTLTVDGTAVDLAEVDDGKYRFSVTKTAVTVSAEFEAQVYTAGVTFTGAGVELEGKVITLINGEDKYEATIARDGAAYKITVNAVVYGTYKAYLAEDGYCVGDVVIGGAGETEEIAITAAWASSTGMKNGQTGYGGNTAKVEIDGENKKFVLGGEGSSIYHEGSNNSTGNGNSYVASVNINIGTDKKKLDSAIVKFTLKLTKDVNGAASWRKAGLAINEKNEGFALYWKDDGQGIIHYLTDRSLDAGSAEGMGSAPVNIDGAYKTAVAGDGLEALVIKAGDKLQVLLKSGGEFRLVYSADIDENSLSKIEFMGSYCDWEFSDISYTFKDGLAYHSEVKPTVTEYGKKAHFTDKAGNFYNELGEAIDENTLVIGKLAAVEDVTISLGAGVATAKENLTITDVNGGEVEFTVTGGVVSIAAVAEGKVEVTDAVTGLKYSFDVSETNKSFTIANKTVDDIAEFTTETASDGADLFSDALAAETLGNSVNYIVETTIKDTDDIGDANTWRAVGIRLTATDIIYFRWHSYQDVYNTSDGWGLIQSGNGTMQNAGPGGISVNMPSFFNDRTALTTTGLKTRIARYGDNVKIYGFNPGTNEWELMAEATVSADAPAVVRLGVCKYCAWSFTDTKITVATVE